MRKSFVKWKRFVELQITSNEEANRNAQKEIKARNDLNSALKAEIREGIRAEKKFKL